MKPSWTQAVWPPVKPLVSVEDARNWLGIYGDSSIDPEVEVCLNSATEKIASNVNYRISDTQITDYFPDTARDNLVLSEPGVDKDTIEVKYYDINGISQTVDSYRYLLDPTSEEHTIFWVDGEFPLDVSSTMKHPILVQYSSKLSNILGVPSVDRIKYAIRMTLNWYWQSRGQLQDPRMLDKSLSSILQSCKDNPAIGNRDV